MKKFGLIGKSLEHSFSPAYFEKKFKEEKIKATYEAFEMDDVSELKSFLLSQDVSGVNVTIPFKKDVLAIMDELDPISSAVQAVNTIKVINNKLFGYNTDVIGFQKSLQKFIENQQISALVIGSGGASLAVTHALKSMHIAHKIVSRSPSASSITYEQLTPKLVLSHKLIINTTPVGMFPLENEHPDLPIDFITENHLVYDLIYNPDKTRLLALAEKNNASIKNGLEMLHLQAEESWAIWNS